MKVEVKTQNKSKSLPFPKLMKLNDSDLIVLFTGKNKGIVINSIDNFRIGTYAEDWIIDSFTDFKGSITITQ